MTPFGKQPTSKWISHRYLTKMCDQVVSLISSEHAQTILWNEEEDSEDEDILEVDHDESDRMFTFEVSQTNEQEETVAVRKGFKVSSSLLCDWVDGTDVWGPTSGRFVLHRASRGTRGRSRPDEACPICTSFTLWRDDTRIHDSGISRGKGCAGYLQRTVDSSHATGRIFVSAHLC